MLGKVQTPKNKTDLVKSIQAIPQLDFSVIEMGSQRDKQNVIRSLDKMVSKGPVSVILIQEK